MSKLQAPRLVVLGGDHAGTTFEVQSGTMLIGRGADAELRLPAAELSRVHAYIRREGDRVTIADADSSNGTFVNGLKISQSRALEPGDVVGLGSVLFRYEAAPVRDDVTAVMRAMPRVNGHAGIANRVGRDNHGQIIQANGNVTYENWRVDNRLEFDEPLDEVFHGRGAGRALMVIGLLVAIAGFAGWMMLIFSGFGGDPGSMSSPFDTKIGGLSAAPVAFGAFAGGGLLASVGMAMSRAARRREDGPAAVAPLRIRGHWNG